MKKQYVVVTPFFPTETSFRGPYVYDQVRAIGRCSDLETIVIKTTSLFHRDKRERYAYGGIEVHNFPVYDLPSSLFPGFFQAINLARFEKLLSSLGVVPERIVAVHAHTAYPAGALAVDFARRHGIKSVVQHHGLDVMQLSNGRIAKGFIKRLNDAHIARRFMQTSEAASLHVGVSRKVLDALENTGATVHTSYVLYNGVDPEKFHPLPTEHTPGTFRIGCIGNFWPTKGQMVLLKALAKVVKGGHKECHVTFIGSGPELPRCRAFVEKMELETFVTFKKEIDHTELNRFYNDLDLFVLPSSYEAFGCVYAEALQVGIPVIGVKGQGIEEILHPQDRETMLIDAEDDEALASLLIRHIETPKKGKIGYDLSIDRFVCPFLKEVLIS